MKKHNFNAGPAILPASVLQQAARAVEDLDGSGLSILEISHRSKAFTAIIEEAEQNVRDLLGAGDDYAVLFLTGGASSQFFMTAMNLLNANETAAYLDTGSWSNKAIKEAKLFGKVEVIASSKADNYTYIPREFTVPANARYLHLTSNNTIFGTQYHWWPETSTPLVADMSSDILSRPIPMERFGLIYAGAQKNIGPAGVTLVIIRKDMLREMEHAIPAMLKYSTHIENGSLYNTAPVFPIYVSMLTMRWIKENGGLAGMAARNEAKAKILYDELDANPLFRGSVSVPGDRSLMNITFLPENADHEALFLEACKAAGIEGIKGHRSVGGFRASTYNALPQASVALLVDILQEFARKHG